MSLEAQLKLNYQRLGSITHYNELNHINGQSTTAVGHGYSVPILGTEYIKATNLHHSKFQLAEFDAMLIALCSVQACMMVCKLFIIYASLMCQLTIMVFSIRAYMTNCMHFYHTVWK